ncbi:phytanoyl-CoA dioxygenase family protein [Kamptonema formosum]|uniref:phytanoyl-CoA dioxygenase family protein n=1 Tax=Kamptonema formosum TaxID=331992 RepID=UPI00037B378F|nr:phytanoyl-CoA dioxygenase family protein [Oscillatoria sp. PCC 10802]
MTDTEVIPGRKIPQMNMPWVDSPFFSQLLECSSLDDATKKLAEQFAEDGYVIFDPEIEDFDRLAEDIIENLTPEYLRRQADRIQDAWTFREPVRQIAAAPKVLSLLKVLYQREPIPFQTLSFSKGSQQKTHSDTIHFHSVPARFMCGVWVALEDVDAQKGPLHYYPKSQKLPIFDLQDIGLNSYNMEWQEFYPLYENFIEALAVSQGLEKVDVSLRKGQAIIWAANLLHGGSPILDYNRTRHSQVTHYFFSDCMYYTPMYSDPFINRLYLRSIQNIVTGERVEPVYNGKKTDTGGGKREREPVLADSALAADNISLDAGLGSFVKPSLEKSRGLKPLISKTVNFAKRVLARKR